MRKKHFFARMTRLVREIAEFLEPILKVIKLLIEIADKAVNCHDNQLQGSVRSARKAYL